MQILLTEQEYNSLQKAAKASLDCPDKKKLQEFCTLVAEHLPITMPSGHVSLSSFDFKRPWGCILTPESRTSYCDSCPSREVCPNPSKRWSK